MIATSPLYTSRLRTCVRDEGTVARLGGDEFAVLLEQAPSHEVAVRILEAMRPPVPLQGRQVQIGAMYRPGPAARAVSSWPRPGGALDTVGTIPDT